MVQILKRTPDLRRYGYVPGVTADAAPAFNAAFADLSTVGGELVVPQGVYTILSGLVAPRIGLKIRGVGLNGWVSEPTVDRSTIIRAGAAMTNMFDWSGLSIADGGSSTTQAEHVGMRGIVLDCNNLAQNGIKCWSARGVSFKEMFVRKHLAAGMWFGRKRAGSDVSYNYMLDDVTITDGVDGIVTDGTYSYVFIDVGTIHVRSLTGDAFRGQFQGSLADAGFIGGVNGTAFELQGSINFGIRNITTENCGGRVAFFGTVLSGSLGTVTSTTPVFRPWHVGRKITIPGSGVAGASLTTTIATYVSTTQVTLTVVASTAVAGAACFYKRAAGIHMTKGYQSYGDGTTAGGSIVSGTTTLTMDAATKTFGNSDVTSKTVVVIVGAGPSGADLTTHVSALIGGAPTSQVTVADTASTTVSHQVVRTQTQQCTTGTVDSYGSNTSSSSFPRTESIGIEFAQAIDIGSVKVSSGANDDTDFIGVHLYAGASNVTAPSMYVREGYLSGQIPWKDDGTYGPSSTTNPGTNNLIRENGLWRTPMVFGRPGTTDAIIMGLLDNGLSVGAVNDAVARLLLDLHGVSFGNGAATPDASLYRDPATGIGHLLLNGNDITGPTGAAAIATEISFTARGGSAITWTSMPSSLTEFDGSSSFRRQIDLTNATQARILALLTTSATASSGATLALQYTTDGGSTWKYTDGSDGTVQAPSGASIIIDATTSGVIKKSAWVTIAAGGLTDVMWRVVGQASSSPGSPAFGYVAMQAR